MHASLGIVAALVVSLSWISTAAPIQTVFKVGPISPEDIMDELSKAEVIPDVLSKSFAPLISLSITYAESNASVSLGNDISVSSASMRPVFTLAPLPTLPSNALSPTRTFAMNKTYTLVLTDPDATSRADPVKAQMCHWIITGIKLQNRNSTEGLEGGEGPTYALDMRSPHADLTINNLDKHGDDVFGTDEIEEIMEYLAPAPPPKTGKHRYVFVLLEPRDSDGVGKRKPKKPKDRPHWGYKRQGQGVMDWASENGLVPIGANFFQSQHER